MQAGKLPLVKTSTQSTLALAASMGMGTPSALAAATNAAMMAANVVGTSPATSSDKNKDGDLTSPPRDSLVQYMPLEYADEKAAKLAAQRTGKAAQLQDVLNAILPPREYQGAEIRRILQRVSPVPASRDDVLRLQMTLDEKLQERQARENGICPVREELYSQCFDELIRQVTLESPERGLLLLRVRDEVRMTIAAYQTLYASSITFGMRKTLQAEHGNHELQAHIDTLDQDKKRLQAQVADQKGLYDAIEQRAKEQHQIAEKTMSDEKDFLRHQAANLDAYIKGFQQTNNPSSG